MCFLLLLLVMIAPTAQAQELPWFGATNETHLHMSFRTVTRKEWTAAPTVLKNGVLTSFGEVVMTDEETPYMKALANSLVAPNSTILEIGFGMGISATAIQARGCKKHVIIEPNEEIFSACLAWDDDRRRHQRGGVVIPVKGYWESVTPFLRQGSFDGVFFDPFPSMSSMAFFREARRLLKPGGRFVYYAQEWRGTGRRKWREDRVRLRLAGWTNEEIGRPHYIHTYSKPTCPEDAKCKPAYLTYIVSNVQRRGGDDDA